MTERDPLAGMRQAINDHELGTLLYPLFVGGQEQRCPVQPGEVFELRRCVIVITRIERTKRKSGERVWVALFDRYARNAGDERYLISRTTGKYTADPDEAIELGEDVFHQSPATLDVVEEDDRTPAHKNAGEPPEPEAVPPYEIKHYQASQEAFARRQLELGAERLAEQCQPIEVRLARLRAVAPGRNVDISSEMRVVEKQIAKAERKVLEKAA